MIRKSWLRLRSISALLCVAFLVTFLTVPVESDAASKNKTKKEKKTSGKTSKNEKKTAFAKQNNSKEAEKTKGKAKDQGAPENVPPAEAVALKEADNKVYTLSDDLKVPYLSTYYLEPVIAEGGKQTVKFYVSDWYQSEYRKLDTSHRFKLTVSYWLKDTPKDKKKPVVRTIPGLDSLPAGDHAVETEPLEPGEYRLLLSAEDMSGRKSPVLYHEFWVRKKSEMEISEAETYAMTEKDLRTYDIQSKGDYGLISVRKIGDETVSYDTYREDVLKAMRKDGYAVLISGKRLKLPPKGLSPDKPGAYGCPMPEWIADLRSHKDREIVYGPDYNAKAIEAEAVRTGNGLNKLMADVRAKGMRKLVLLKGHYRISNTTTLEVPSGLTLDLNGSVIKLNQFIGCHGLQIRIRDGFDTHVVNGIVEGDYLEHDYENSEKNSEWVCGVGIDGKSKYCSFRHLLVRYITGYGVTNGFFGFNPYSSVGNMERGTIDRKTGKKVATDSVLAVSGYINISKLHAKSDYLTVSKFLGYQGIGADEWNLRYHFYDSAKAYISTVDGWQYRRVLIPENAAFLRVSAYYSKFPEEWQLTVNFFNVPWNCTFEDIFITHARCVGMAPGAMYNHKIANCTFMRSGESGAFCAFDAEDGWDMAQDVWLVRNLFSGNGRNDLLTCSGHNFVIEENVGKLHLWSRTLGYVVRNNKFESAFFGSGARRRSQLVRVENNTFKGGARFAEDMPADGWTIAMHDSPESITCGEAGVLVGAKLKNVSSSRLNLFGGELTDCESITLDASNLEKCKISNILRSDLRGKVEIKDCQLENVQLDVFQKADLHVSGSELKDVTITYLAETPHGTIEIENSTLENKKKPLITVPASAIGEFSFMNCYLDTGLAPLIFVNRMNERKSDTPQCIRIDASTVTNQTGCVVNHEAGNKVQRVEFKATGSKMPDTFVKDAPGAWQVHNSPGMGFTPVK